MLVMWWVLPGLKERSKFQNVLSRKLSVGIMVNLISRKICQNWVQTWTERAGGPVREDAVG